MPIEFRLPDVGEGIATAEITAWQVSEGDRVSEHQDLVEIQTDKATVVIPCPADGVITRLCGEPGDTLDVGSVLAVIEADGAAANGGSAAQSAPAPAPAPAPVPRARGADAGAGAAVPRAGVPLAAPTSRRLARELGVALDEVAGSGPHGRILREDVERAAADVGAPGEAPPAGASPPGALAPA
ncbi:MAG TPA: biotin/lipoyl-containing protein, partial [Solirubrobacteraceae bacterium]|nr:biotin/lipoyl-containing protein [Solirubrobacteraceae bacterium]